MEKFQVATKADLKEAAIIEHKRRYEEERKARIFNTRNRIFGVRTFVVVNNIAFSVVRLYMLLSFVTG